MVPSQVQISRVLDGNEVPGLLLVCQPTAALPQALLPKEFLAIILICHGQPMFLPLTSSQLVSLKLQQGAGRRRRVICFLDKQKEPREGVELRLWVRIQKGPG